MRLPRLMIGLLFHLHILSTDQIGKSEYRQCEQVQSAIEDIQQGMRDSIVLNNLSVELAKL